MAENIHGMRPSNKSRSRNKPGNSGNHNNNSNNNNNNNNQRRSMGNIINRVFESAGPDGKVRGTPQQIIDKYQVLARDAQLAGDRVAAENYLQHAEHYSRLLGEAQRQQAENSRFQERDDEQRGDDRPQQPRSEDGQQPRHDDGFGNQRRQPALGGPVGSGLTMIDPEDDDMVGPIETPEGRNAPAAAPAPVLAEQPAVPAFAEPVNGASYPATAEPSQDGAPAKRSRPRRRQKADTGTAPEAVSQAE